MVDLAVSTQLQQWSFEKNPTVRPERSGSSASSPDLSHHDPETLRIDASAVAVVQDSQSMNRNASKSMDKKDTLDTRSFQERYMSSEEDLSPMDGNSSDSEYDSDVSIHEFRTECFKARKMSISRWDKGLSCDMAVMVSYKSAGRPKMIDLATTEEPTHEPTQRSASLAQLPIAAINTLRKQDQHARRSLMVSLSTTREPSPATSFDSRRPSTGHSPFTHSNKSALQLSDSVSSFQTDSIRSSSPSVSERSTSAARPVSAAATSHSQPRSSLFLVSTASNKAVSTAPFPPLTPLTPQSPEPHSFLSSDPYDNSTTNAASPIIKSGPHKRLRSISQKLSLAKIAITPSTRKWDSRINGKAGNMPPTPATPHTPITPQTAPIPSSSPMNKLRRNSRILSRPSTQRGPSPEIPPVPTMPASASPRKYASSRMVARGADEREPMIELPPFPARESSASLNNSLNSRKVRKRKSLMDLL